MYDKDYASTWIKNNESGKDVFRVKYLEPYLKKYLSKLDIVSILDVGCGWGIVIKYLKSNQKYSGFDITEEFLDYIKEKYSNKKFNLKSGSLPNNIPYEEKFDCVICSMVLHTVSNLRKSIEVLKTKTKSRLLIIEFNDEAKVPLKDSFVKKEYEKEDVIEGIVKLPSGLEVDAEVFFYKEQDIENELTKNGFKFEKKYLGPLFVAYDCKL
jgi:ubiquinone/menaquinone biosynthesis C-methylase UbiE